MEKDDYYKTLNTINLWLQNCDTKVSILLGLFTIVISFLFSNDSYDLLEFIFVNCQGQDDVIGYWLMLLLFVLSLLIFLFGIFELISALIPRRFEQKPSKMFWGAIASNYKINYRKIGNNGGNDIYKVYEEDIKNYSEQDVIQDLTYQICACANIASIKFRKQKKGTIFSTIGLILMMLLLIIATYYH